MPPRYTILAVIVAVAALFLSSSVSMGSASRVILAEDFTAVW